MANLIEVRVPDIGDFRDVEVIELAVQPGDAVSIDATLVTLETEKATMDVPSTVAGVIRELKVQRGSRVSQGDLIAIVEGEAALAGTPPTPAGEVGQRPGEGPGKMRAFTPSAPTLSHLEWERVPGGRVRALCIR